MGATVSKVDTSKDVLNAVISQVFSKSTSGGLSSVEQENILILTNVKGTTIKGIVQENVASVNINMLAQKVSNGSLQADLINSLTSAISSNQDLIGYGESDIKVRSSVSNVINNNISTETINTLQNTINQKNTIVGYNLESSVVDIIKQANKSDVVMKLVDTISSEIIASLQAKTTATDTVTVSQSSPLNKFFETMQTAVMGTYILMVVGVIAFAVVAVVMGPTILKNSPLGLFNRQKQAPQITMVKRKV